MKLYYDFHTHSCLSPCGDNDMTPYNLVNMAKLLGLDIIALTDHNTCENCASAIKAGEAIGLTVIPGMELCTSEEVHVVCLFPDVESAMEFSDYVISSMPPVKNRPDIFGQQQILEGQDNVIGEEENLLINATLISVNEVPDLVGEFGGICYPAHIDRQSNGIISVLGTFPDTPHFNCVEFHDGSKADEYVKKYNLQDKKIIVSSDAHNLCDMRDKQNYFDIDDEPYSSALVRKKLFELLR